MQDFYPVSFVWILFRTACSLTRGPHTLTASRVFWQTSFSGQHNACRSSMDVKRHALFGGRFSTRSETASSTCGYNSISSGLRISANLDHLISTFIRTPTLAGFLLYHGLAEVLLLANPRSREHNFTPNPNPLVPDFLLPIVHWRTRLTSVETHFARS
jgi:hypothetical protein